MTETILLLIAGLILFLYAISHLSDTLRSALGDNAKTWMAKYTGNTLSSVLVGLVVTTLLDSSSAVIIITIVFVNSGFLTLRQAMGIVLGANIGTTVSSQIIAMDVGKYSPVFLLIGFVLLMASRNERNGNIGRVILYFGVLFFGLFTMENAVEPMHDNPGFADWMKRTELPLMGALVGAVVTLWLQSSSATVGMAIILAKKGMIGMSGGIAVMLGAELGTCSDTLLATIKGTRDALRTGIFHLTFNIISISLGLLLFQPFVGLVQYISSGESLERSIANAHMLFNTLGVLLFVGTLPMFERMLRRLIPDKAAPAEEAVSA
ncbi:MAG: Na/Pi cotransporter family protein [Chitinophagia bacterium]|nr:Na/Pi cotransporter family protein [Chitinophagia bacterium]